MENFTEEYKNMLREAIQEICFWFDFVQREVGGILPKLKLC